MHSVEFDRIYSIRTKCHLIRTFDFINAMKQHRSSRNRDVLCRDK